MKRSSLGVLIFAARLSLPASPAFSQGILVDHRNEDLSQISDYWIEQVKRNRKVYYGHTFHGSQVRSGLELIESQLGSKCNIVSSWGFPNEAETLCMQDRSDTYDPGDFSPTVPGALNGNPSLNVVMYACCGQPAGANWRALLDQYIQDMNRLEQQYPPVTFVFPTIGKTFRLKGIQYVGS